MKMNKLEQWLNILTKGTKLNERWSNIDVSVNSIDSEQIQSPKLYFAEILISSVKEIPVDWLKKSFNNFFDNSKYVDLTMFLIFEVLKMYLN